MNPLDARWLFYDYGLFISLAQLIAHRIGREVDYFVPWETSFADGRELVIGHGVPGIHRLKHFDSAVDEADIIVFPDCHDRDLQQYLRKHGYRVWGSGWGSELELLRWRTKQRLRAGGVDIGKCQMVTGVNALREFFKACEGDTKWFVKVSTLRGIGETWGARNYTEAKGRLDELEFKHGGIASILDFIVEQEIEGVELGYDGFCIDGKFPSISHYGIEKKERAYLGEVCSSDAMPAALQKLNQVLSPVMKELGYRNFFSSEMRGVHPLDLTARHASPAGECLAHNMTNLVDVLWQGSRGVLVEPEFEFQHCAQLVLCSKFAETGWIYYQIPEKVYPFAKMYNQACLSVEGIGETYCFVPQIAPQSQVGSVVGFGDSPGEAIDQCTEHAQAMKMFGLEYDEEALEEAAEELSAPAGVSD